MDNPNKEREEALKVIKVNLRYLSTLYHECFLEKGRGSIVLHSFRLKNISRLSSIDYNTKNESLDLFDDNKSRSELSLMIDEYDPLNEGVLVFITSSNATCFETLDLDNP